MPEYRQVTDAQIEGYIAYWKIGKLKSFEVRTWDHKRPFPASPSLQLLSDSIIPNFSNTHMSLLLRE